MLIAFIGVLMFAFALYHAIRYIKGSHKHRIKLVNIVLIALAAVSFVLLEVDQKAIDSKRSKYEVRNGTVLSALEYRKQENGCYFFHESALFSSGEFVIKQSDAELPWISRIYSPVAIYCRSDAATGWETIGGRVYARWDDVVQIVPDYAWLFIAAMIFAGLILITFDAVMLLRYLIVKKAEGGQIPDEDEKEKKS